MNDREEKVKRTGGRSARVREAVLRAAAEELEEHGYERFSIAAVARRAQVHETSIYRRWQTREALAAEIGRLTFQTDSVPKDCGSLREDLIWLVLTSIAILNTSMGRMVLGRAASARPGTPEFDMAVENGARRMQYVEHIFTRAIDRGEWDAQLPWRRYVELLLGAMQFRFIVTKEPVDRAYVEEMLELILATARLQDPRSPK